MFVRKTVARNEDQTSGEERLLQEGKYRDIMSYLVCAGYFRARDNTVSSFDKVVGGACWAITQIHNRWLDVDVVFRGTSTTGQNIKLAEEVISCIRKMNCPSPLQAHQIQGHDWAQVHPVIVFLLQRMYEARDDLGAGLRQYSEQQFSKAFLLPRNKAKVKTEESGLDLFLEESSPAAMNEFFPERRFRYAGDKALANEESAVFSCLLEYGESISKLNSQQEENTSTVSAATRRRGDATGHKTQHSEFEKKLKSLQDDEAEVQSRDIKAEQALQSNMTSIQPKGSVSGAQVGEMVRLGAGEIAQATKKYQAARNAAPISGEQLEREALAVLEKKKAKAKATVANVIEKKDLAKKRRDTAAAALAVLVKEQEEAQAFNARLEVEISKLKQIEIEFDPSKKRDLLNLQKLVARHEHAKRSERSFKSSCKTKLAQLKAELSELNKNIDSDDMKRYAEIEAVHTKVLAKDARLRRQVGTASRKIATTARLIDDVPTRAELVQYERRFHELYAQVAAKLDETRKYYELYNSLDEICQIHTKEVNILNSIIDTFSQAMRTKQGKQTFLQQLEDINAGLRKNLALKRDLFEKAQLRSNSESKHYQALLDEHRKYHTAVKDFHEECQKNDLLQARIRQLQQQKKSTS